MYVKMFSHWNYTNIWYNTTFLAWYFEKLKSSDFTGEVWIGLQLPVDRFWWEWSGSHRPGRNMCFVTPKRRGFCALSSHLGFKLFATGQFAFIAWNSTRRCWWPGSSCVQYTWCQANEVLLQKLIFFFFFFLRKQCSGLLNTKENFDLDLCSVWCQISNRFKST